MTRELTRRDLLGIAGAAGSVALAGCGGVLGDKRGVPGTPGTKTESNGDDSGSDIPEGVPEAIHTWLMEGDGGQSANIYSNEPAAEDLTGQDSVTIANGAGSGFAFDPTVAIISTGTEVTWEWTGAGGAHNVSTETNADAPSDFEFRSGAAESGSGITFSQTFEEAGQVAYVCEPHAPAGMMGAIVVQE